ncbi:MAG: hypothetical protein SAJ37_07190 [Oscillatoria sp. PMC 1068.18]|nr:hypothetical protein [Oscillatoria sp. PMC 1076.18]MEC4988517.1 hypothetical protein [Oscillatoria sp. PMC 1068.18]
MKTKIINVLLLTTIINYPSVVINSSLITATKVLAQPSPNCQVISVIEIIRGGVSIKRNNNSQYQPTTSTTELCLGDIFITHQDIEAILRCQVNNSAIRINEAERRFGANYSCPLEPSSNSRNMPRGDDKPLIISYGNLFSQQPTLRWFPPTQGQAVEYYKVELIGGEEPWEKNLIQDTKVIYDGQILELGRDYVLKITAVKEGGSESLSRTELNLVSEAELAQIKVALTQILEIDLESDKEALAIADLYLSNELNADAIDILMSSVEKNTQNPDIYRKLGDIYQQMSLKTNRNFQRLANNFYLTAEEIETQQ